MFSPQVCVRLHVSLLIHVLTQMKGDMYTYLCMYNMYTYLYMYNMFTPIYIYISKSKSKSKSKSIGAN